MKKQRTLKMYNTGTRRKYPMGGEVGDPIDYNNLDEDQIAELQAQADDQNITLEELIQNLQAQDEGSQDNQQMQPDMVDDVVDDEADPNIDDGTSNSYAYGGKVRTKRKLTKYAMGGKAIEVEGGEVVEPPNGNIMKIRGKSHAQGGVDINVPNGTNIYSDRLSIDGETMAERKTKRERKIRSLEKILGANPSNKLTQNTVKRVKEVTDIEEQQDMNIMKIADAVHNNGKKKYPYGGTTPYSSYGNQYQPIFNPYDPANYGEGSTPTPPFRSPYMDTGTAIGDFNPPIMDSTTPITGGAPTLTPNPKTMGKPAVEPGGAGKMGIGDYIGLGSSIIGAVGEAMNTKRNWQATKPSINHYLGRFHKAIDTNEAAQDYVAGMKTDANIDLNTSADSGYARNRNSASGVNTVRALDIATSMAKDKGRNAINDTYGRQMIGLLGQEAQLQNQEAFYEGQGEHQAATENQQNVDNYFSNRAANIATLSETGQTIGKNLNISRSNKVDANLLSQLSQYGLEFDENGNLISKKQ